jgi:hypothetical protein
VLRKFFFLLSLVFALSGTAIGQSDFPACTGDDRTQWNNCILSENTINDLAIEDKDKDKVERKIYIIKDVFKRKENSLHEYPNFHDAWAPWDKEKNVYFRLDK